MKLLFSLFILAFLPAIAAAYTVTITNVASPTDIRFVKDEAGNPLPTTQGSVSVGYFNGLTDSQVTALQTTPWGVQTAITSWRAFGPVKRLGTTNQAGSFNLVFSAPLNTGSQFYGKKVYVVVGNRESLWASTSLLVLRSNKFFTGTTGTSYTAPTSPNSAMLFGSSLASGTWGTTEPPKPDYATWIQKYQADYPASDLDSPYDDADGDGLTNEEEWAACMNPCNLDSDEDAISDWEELYPGAPMPSFGNVPRLIPTNPRSPDTDGDGTRDGDELALGTDPVRAASRPVISQGMQAFWPMDGHPADLLGGRILAGGTGKWSASATHKALRLAGASLTTGVELPAGAPGFGLAFRLRLAAHTQPDQILAAVPGFWTLQCIGTTGRVRLTVGDRSVESTTDLADGALHQLGLSVAWHARIELWVDGQMEGRDRELPARPATGGTLVIGSPGLDGWLDEVVLWNRFLTQSDLVTVTTAAGSNWCLAPGHADWRVRAAWQETAADGTSRFCMAWPLCETGNAVLQASPDLVSPWQTLGVPADPCHMEPLPAGAAPRFFRVIRP